MSKPKDVESYIALAPSIVQSKLRELRAAIKSAAPEASEGISYGMAYYNYKGSLVWFGLMKNHIGLYFRPPIVRLYTEELAKYKTTKSAIHIPLDQKLPLPLIKKLVRARMKINEGG